MAERLRGGEHARVRLFRGGGLREPRVVVRELRRDAEHRMDRGHDVADVAHVGARVRLDRLRPHGLPQRRRVRDVAVRHRAVGAHVVVAARAPFVLQPAAGGLRRALEAGEHALTQFIDGRAVAGANHEPSLRVVGDHVGGLAALRDDAVDALVGADVLAQHGDRVVAGDQRVERVQPVPRRGGGVCVAPVEVDDQALDRRHQRPRPAVQGAAQRAGMQHHRRVDLRERARLDQADLPAPALLGGRAEHDDRAVAFAERRLQAERDGDAGGGDQVVAAGVADARQRVVFADHRDRRPAAAGHRLERRLHPVCAAFDGEAARFEESGQRGVCVMLLEPQFRVGVDVEAQFAQLRVRRLDRLVRDRLRAVVAHRLSPSSGGNTT